MIVTALCYPEGSRAKTLLFGSLDPYIVPIDPYISPYQPFKGTLLLGSLDPKGMICEKLQPKHATAFPVVLDPDLVSKKPL